MPDQYTRTRAQLGTPALDVLRRAHVAVFGIGGVGGQAVEVLARSGVGELSLFDSDTVALSNLNRQLVALHSTLGQYKVDAMAARIADIDPTIIVHANRMFYNAETAPDVDLTQFDYVLDCIDTVSAKLLLIRCCKKDGVPILCSMGAANKLDPTAFRVADIEKTTVDPLAKVIRLECRKRRLGKVKVVFSEEQTLPPLQEEIEEAPTAARRTVPASNAFVPAAAGLIIAGEVVRDIANGEPQKQLSKEFVREWLMENDFQGKAGQKVPEMTPAIVDGISERYIELYEHITGEKFEKGDTDNLLSRIEKNVTEYLNK